MLANTSVGDTPEPSKARYDQGNGKGQAIFDLESAKTLEPGPVHGRASQVLDPTRSEPVPARARTRARLLRSGPRRTIPSSPWLTQAEDGTAGSARTRTQP